MESDTSPSVEFRARWGGATSILGGRGVGPDIKFRGKIWAKISQVDQIRGKIWEVLLPQDAKVAKESQF